MLSDNAGDVVWIAQGGCRAMAVGRIVAAVLVGAALGCTPQDESVSGVEVGPDNAEVDALFSEWDQADGPGCALAVARGGELVYSRGYGSANLDYGIPITPQTVFDVASITKQFVAASLSLLAQEGTLSLDDDVRVWLPEMPEYEWPITLRQLLHHTSGLRDYLNLFPLAGRPNDSPISHAQILAMMSRQRALQFRPGDRYAYSNTAYMLLAQVVERASGRSLGEFAQEHIFEPLGMDGSVMYDDLHLIISRRATGYGLDGDGDWRRVHNDIFDVAGDGQLYSTVEDLLLWDEHLHGGTPPAIHPMMLTEGVLNDGGRTGYALGLRLEEVRSLATVGHSGGSWGFGSEIVRFIEAGLSVAVACNSDEARARRLASQVAEHFLAGQLGPPEVEEPDDASEQSSEATPDGPVPTLEELAYFVGAFFSPELDAIYRFEIAAGALWLRIEQEPRIEVTRLDEERFEIRFEEHWAWGPEKATLDVERDGGRRVIGFALSSGAERDLFFVRVAL